MSAVVEALLGLVILLGEVPGKFSQSKKGLECCSRHVSQKILLVSVDCFECYKTNWTINPDMDNLPQQVECCDLRFCKSGEAKKDGILFQEEIINV